MKKLMTVAGLMLVSSAAFAGTVGDMSDVPDARAEKEKDLSGFLGLGAVSRPKYIGSDNNDTIPVPLISVDYKDTAYFKLNHAGVWFWKQGKEGFRAGAVLQPRRGWRRNDGNRLTGMDTRGDSVEAGVNLAWRYERAELEGAYLTDISGNSSGDSGYIKGRYRLVQSSTWNLSGQLGFEYLSSDVADYYFGVSPSEARPGRPAYSPGKSWNTSVSLVATYLFSDSWLAMGGVSYTVLGDDIQDSPIVESDDYTNVFAGVAWRF
jgi:outer membrane protein